MNSSNQPPLLPPLLTVTPPTPQLSQNHILQLQGYTPYINTTSYVSPNPVCDFLTGNNSSLDKINGRW